MILRVISATNFTQLAKIPCIFVEILERNQRFFLDFFAFGEKNRGVGLEGFALTTHFISAN
jgi:hypothetical protein